MGHIWLSGKGELDLDIQRVFCDVGEHIKYFVWEVIMSLGNINYLMCQKLNNKKELSNPIMS